MSRGLEPTREVLNALSYAHATRGNIEAAAALYEEGSALDSIVDRPRCDADDPRYQDFSRAARRSAAIARRNEHVAVATLLSACVYARAPSRRPFALFERIRRRGYVADAPHPYVPLLHAAAAAGSPSLATTALNLAARAGVRPTRAMLNAALSAYARCGHVDGAFDVLNQSVERGARPDGATVTTLLHACAVARAPRCAADALRVADDFNVGLNGRALSLLIWVHVAPLMDARSDLRRARGGGVDDGEVYGSPSRRRRGRLDVDATWMLDEAMRVYDDGSARGVAWQPKMRRVLLAASTHARRIGDAMRLLSHMEARGEDAGYRALDELVRAQHDAGAIDDDTLELWGDDSDVGGDGSRPDDYGDEHIDDDSFDEWRTGDAHDERPPDWPRR